MYQHGKFYIPSGPNTKKVRNLQKKFKATLVIDDEDTERGLMVECESKVLRGEEAEAFRKYLRGAKNWKNDDTTVVIQLDPQRKVSWFLN